MHVSRILRKTGTVCKRKEYLISGYGHFRSFYCFCLRRYLSGLSLSLSSDTSMSTPVPRAQSHTVYVRFIRDRMLHPSLSITVPPLPNIQPSADRSKRKGRSVTQIQRRLNRIQEEAVLALQVRGSTRNKCCYERAQESHLFLLCCYASPPPTAVFAHFFTTDDASITSP